MMRRFFAVLLVICVVFSFAACKQETTDPVDTFATKEEEIRKAWGDMGEWYDVNDPATTYNHWRYYGEYEGYDILFQATPAETIEIKTIAGQNLVHGCYFHIYAYRNGHFIKLEDAYAKGKLSAESICDIAVIHMQHEEEIYGGDYVESLYAGLEKPE
jgi:hypothetical protein